MESISSIKSQYALAASEEELKAFIAEYSGDERQGVKNLVKKAEAGIEAVRREIMRTESLKVYEKKYESFGFVCGIDEVGRGPLAGPVYAAAVILPKDSGILYLNDSKKLTEKKREELYDVIMKEAVS
ncbi:MAG: ribonuclease HII, partial [Lachnospiraceae bacterium]|nr:ribonuclease HII [Lachnospiraceae bacterium]